MSPPVAAGPSLTGERLDANRPDVVDNAPEALMRLGWNRATGLARATGTEVAVMMKVPTRAMAPPAGRSDTRDRQNVPLMTGRSTA